MGCSSLTSITIPNSVTSIGDYALVFCSGLNSIVVESGNTVYDSRENCNAIIETSSNTLHTGCKNTVIPNSVTSIGLFAFDGCSGLTSITIPNSVTSIGISAFEGCNGLTSITIPSSVTSIGGSVFWNCRGLTSVIVEWEIPITITLYIFDSSIYQDATLYVPMGCKDAYQAASVWQNFSKIVETSATSIEGIDCSLSSEVVIYDLNGRRLTAVPKNGPYIKNGKKYIQK